MAKGIAKSIRISEEVFDYINEAPGEGFNQKFENIILQAKKGEAERLKTLAELDRRIEKAQTELYDLFDRNRYMEDFFRTFLSMQHSLHNMKEKLDKALQSEH